MNNIKKNLTELVGNTPMMYLDNYKRNNKLKANFIGKLEYFNPTNSIKDRAALNMLVTALDSGKIDKNTTIIEPTSGNTGIGLAGITSALGMKLKIVLPDSFSIERRKLLSGLGAELILTPGAEGISGAIKKAEELVKETPNSFIPQQFNNPANSEAHKKTTAVEIWNDTDGKVDIVVCGVGTGGTITGIGEALKAKNPDIKMIAVEPKESAVLSGNESGQHSIQGIGAGFIPKILNMDIIDEVIQVPGKNAVETARELAVSEGLLVGISSGAATYAASLLALKKENKGKNIVIILPDTGERYLTSDLY